MPTPTRDDRRKSRRQSCEHDYLQVDDRSAALVDWSFGGLGLRFDGGVDLTLGQAVTIRIFDAVSDRWEALEGVVRWIDPDGMVGVAFREADPRAPAILLRLLGSSLSGVDTPDHPPVAATAPQTGPPPAAARPTVVEAVTEPPAAALSAILLDEFDTDETAG
ncbi:MAG: PilZ domain-containing protein [Rhodospirillaceae bacterium]